MLTRSHSRTAEATAAIRACHLRHDHPVLFADPYAQALTSPVWRRVCDSRVLHWLLVRVLLRGLRPVHGWILVRDHLTERCLERFVAAGNRQFVLLGRAVDADALAMHVLARSQGIATLANAFGDEAFLRQEVDMLTDWLDTECAPAAGTSRSTH